MLVDRMESKMFKTAMKFSIINVLMVTGIVAASGTCSPKILGSSDTGVPACDVLFGMSDTSWGYWQFSFVMPPNDSAYDSTHIAALKSHVQDAFSKYEVHSQYSPYDRITTPPDVSKSGYDYGPYRLTKATVLKLVQEPYISTMYYRSDSIHTTVFPHGGPTQKIQVGKEQHLFNVVGQRMSENQAKAVNFHLPN
jgi:hypothetical protein